MEKVVFREREAAEYLAVSRGYLRQDRMYGLRENREPGPNFVKIGRTIRYLKADLDAWLTKHYVDRQLNS